MNAANEVAVEAFLDGCIGYTEIPRLIEKVMDAHDATKLSSLSDVMALDVWSRKTARELIKR
jgi:1-deoxy-D-xylulose-5-phosphate reductoisomerase